ncbi:MAG TPA: hypothetical protein VHE78_15380 [Gemmatimonadaceae bacterium]|nr:hypothetical protein [Gemmatimonadaceae bacterium]
MTETERETAGAVRSASVAHFFPPDWTQVAQRVSGALERTSPTLDATQMLVTVPDGSAALALGRELRSLGAGTRLRVLPVMNAARAARLLKTAPAHIVVGTPAALAGLLAASALRMGAVHTLLLASADEYGSQLEPLGALMAELPRGCARILTAGEATPLVEDLLERYLHRARRVIAPVPAPLTLAVGTPPTICVRTVSALSPLAPLGELLDELDPPSAAVVVPDARTEGRIRTTLEALGYSPDSPLVQVTRSEVALHTQLVLFAGLPEPAALSAALNAHPARIVALITTRQHRALKELAAPAVLVPYEQSRGARAARERDATLRGVLRAALADGLPSREIVALEPLLADFDGLEIAGAALRLYEKAAAEATAAKLAGREEVRAEIRAAKADREAADARIQRPRRLERPKPAGFDRSRPPRGTSDKERTPRRPK